MGVGPGENLLDGQSGHLHGFRHAAVFGQQIGQPHAARQAAAGAGLGAECRNPFRSILVRAVEVVYAVEEALRIILGYQQPDRPAVEVQPQAGSGHGVSEAPRGLLYHRYELDAGGSRNWARAVYNYRWAPQTDPFGVVHRTIDYPGVPVDHRLVELDGLALGDLPLHDLALDDAFADVGQSELVGHGYHSRVRLSAPTIGIEPPLRMKTVSFLNVLCKASVAALI